MAIALLVVDPVSAATLDLAGPHGNAAGCAFAKDPAVSSEEKLLLQPDHIEGYESYCEFVQVLMSKSGSSVVTTLCGGEGETWINHIVVSPADPENGNLRQVFHANGNLWGEVSPCE